MSGSGCKRAGGTYIVSRLETKARDTEISLRGVTVAMAQTVSAADLDPEPDFSESYITPAINDDGGESDSDLCLSNHFSNIEKESELRIFAQALRMAQVTALKKENKKKGVYSKRFKKTLKRCMQHRIELELKGYYSMDKYMEFKAKK